MKPRFDQLVPLKFKPGKRRAGFDRDAAHQLDKGQHANIVIPFFHIKQHCLGGIGHAPLYLPQKRIGKIRLQPQYFVLSHLSSYIGFQPALQRRGIEDYASIRRDMQRTEVFDEDKGASLIFVIGAHIRIIRKCLKQRGQIAAALPVQIPRIPNRHLLRRCTLAFKQQHIRPHIVCKAVFTLCSETACACGKLTHSLAPCGGVRMRRRAAVSVCIMDE